MVMEDFLIVKYIKRRNIDLLAKQEKKIEVTTIAKD